MAVEQYMTVGEAAAELGVSGSFVSSLVKRGHLVAVVRFGLKLIPRAQVLRRKRLKEAGKLPKGGANAWKTTTPQAAAKAKKRPKQRKDGTFAKNVSRRKSISAR